MELTQKFLKEALDYNPDTGIFTWKIRPLSHFKNAHGMNTFNSKQANKATGAKNYGYLVIRINNVLYRAHRLAWLYVYGYMPVNQIDHINNIRDDNRIINLREATNGENCQNLKTVCKNNKSAGLLGAYRDKGCKKFKARITINGNIKPLGKFDTAQEAHEAYIEAKRELHGYNTL